MQRAPSRSMYYEEQTLNGGQMSSRKVANTGRATGLIRILPPTFDTQDYEDTFIAIPTDELPKNRLVDQLAKGLSLYVQRMQKRESYYITVRKMESKKWVPIPRENSTLTFVNYSAFLIGGLNYGID